MDKKNFVRVVENFRCGNCGYEVVGNGYTDHCPNCLWGKHVDREIPGDRESDCQQLMEPMGVIYQKDNYKIIYKCSGCSHRFEVWASEDDDREELIKRVGKI